MKTISWKTMTDTCPICGTNLKMEKVAWTEMKGSLYYVHCDKCKIHGEGATCEAKAFDNFDKKRKQRERDNQRKPEKILTDIRDYLVAILDEWNRRIDEPNFYEQNIGVYNHIRKELDDLIEYAEKLGVEL